MQIRVDVRAALKDVTRTLKGLERQQLPFVLAQTATETAREVAKAETAGLSKVFDRPTPFTKRAFMVIPALKKRPVAIVQARDIQDQYLEPYESHGSQWLGSKRAMLTPADVGLNSYGNLPVGTIQALKGRRDVFIGAVKLKDGRTLNGIWQRPLESTRLYGDKRSNRSGHLKLLVVFTDPKPVTKDLRFADRAQRVAAATLRPAFDRNMAKALQTAVRR